MWFTLKISSSFIFGLIKNSLLLLAPIYCTIFKSSIFYRKTVILHKIAFYCKLHHKCRIWLFHDFPIERQQNRITSVEKWHQNLNKKPECDPHNLMEKPEAAEKWSLYVHFLQHNGHKKNFMFRLSFLSLKMAIAPVIYPLTCFQDFHSWPNFLKGFQFKHDFLKV